MTEESSTPLLRAESFPESPEDWCLSPAHTDAQMLEIAGHPIMNSWQRSYMQMLARVATSNGGRVLELGYGMGISASYIQSNPNVTNHVVIEFHPDICKNAIEQHKGGIAKQRFTLISDMWQNVVQFFSDESFDGILFDTYPLDADEAQANHFVFFETAFRLLRQGGLLTYFSDEPTTLSDEHISKLLAAGFDADNINYEVCDLSSLTRSEYWPYESIVVPVITK